ncbi:DUF3185 family protein [Lewinella cohaerens]|jgi:hypothetical protein|uniref:DUF3185 family protein n=1 Tax=Lewinella cohaerens TaxID=70995 RepID=UPI00036376E6|nr:DUF3185 family protein [Lewinella cohaerens]
MNKLIGLILLLAGIAAGVYGFQLYQDATADISILGLDISASDKEATQQAYIFFGLGVVGVIAGLIFWKKTD